MDHLALEVCTFWQRILQILVTFTLFERREQDLLRLTMLRHPTLLIKAWQALKASITWTLRNCQVTQHAPNTPVRRLWLMIHLSCILLAPSNLFIVPLSLMNRGLAKPLLIHGAWLCICRKETIVGAFRRSKFGWQARQTSVTIVRFLGERDVDKFALFVRETTSHRRWALMVSPKSWICFPVSHKVEESLARGF